MWASYQQDKSVGGWVNIIDGRMTIFDQFMANVQFAVNRSVLWHKESSKTLYDILTLSQYFPHLCLSFHYFVVLFLSLSLSLSLSLFESRCLRTTFCRSRRGFGKLHRSFSEFVEFHEATSTVGARWLAAKGLSPDLIFLDSAHEADETFLERACRLCRTGSDSQMMRIMMKRNSSFSGMLTQLQLMLRSFRCTSSCCSQEGSFSEMTMAGRL